MAAAALSVITFGITAARNVPLNNALADVGTPQSHEMARAAREVNEQPWIFWNDIRTYTSTLGFAAAVGALAMLP